MNLASLLSGVAADQLVRRHANQPSRGALEDGGASGHEFGSMMSQFDAAAVRGAEGQGAAASAESASGRGDGEESAGEPAADPAPAAANLATPFLEPSWAAQFVASTAPVPAEARPSAAKPSASDSAPEEGDAPLLSESANAPAVTSPASASHRESAPAPGPSRPASQPPSAPKSGAEPLRLAAAPPPRTDDGREQSARASISTRSPAAASPESSGPSAPADARPLPAGAPTHRARSNEGARSAAVSIDAGAPRSVAPQSDETTSASDASAGSGRAKAASPASVASSPIAASGPMAPARHSEPAPRTDGARPREMTLANATIGRDQAEIAASSPPPGTMIAPPPLAMRASSSVAAEEPAPPTAPARAVAPPAENRPADFGDAKASAPVEEPRAVSIMRSEPAAQRRSLAAAPSAPARMAAAGPAPLGASVAPLSSEAEAVEPKRADPAAAPPARARISEQDSEQVSEQVSEPTPERFPLERVRSSDEHSHEAEKPERLSDPAPTASAPATKAGARNAPVAAGSRDRPTTPAPDLSLDPVAAPARQAQRVLSASVTAAVAVDSKEPLHSTAMPPATPTVVAPAANAPRVDERIEDARGADLQRSAAPQARSAPANAARVEIGSSHSQPPSSDFASPAAFMRDGPDPASSDRTTRSGVAVSRGVATTAALFPSEAAPPGDAPAPLPPELHPSDAILSARPASRREPVEAPRSEPGRAADPASAMDADSLPITTAAPARPSVEPPAVVATAVVPPRREAAFRFDSPETIAIDFAPPARAASATLPPEPMLVSAPIASGEPEAKAPSSVASVTIVREPDAFSDGVVAPGPIVSPPNVNVAPASLPVEAAESSASQPAAAAEPSRDLHTLHASESIRPAPVEVATPRMAEPRDPRPADTTHAQDAPHASASIAAAPPVSSATRSAEAPALDAASLRRSAASMSVAQGDARAESPAAVGADERVFAPEPHREPAPTSQSPATDSPSREAPAVVPRSVAPRAAAFPAFVPTPLGETPRSEPTPAASLAPSPAAAPAARPQRATETRNVTLQGAASAEEASMIDTPPAGEMASGPEISLAPAMRSNSDATGGVASFSASRAVEAHESASGSATPIRSPAPPPAPVGDIAPARGTPRPEQAGATSLAEISDDSNDALPAPVNSSPAAATIGDDRAVRVPPPRVAAPDLRSSVGDIASPPSGETPPGAEISAFAFAVRPETRTTSFGALSAPRSVAPHEVASGAAPSFRASSTAMPSAPSLAVSDDIEPAPASPKPEQPGPTIFVEKAEDDRRAPAIAFSSRGDASSGDERAIGVAPTRVAAPDVLPHARAEIAPDPAPLARTASQRPIATPPAPGEPVATTAFDRAAPDILASAPDGGAPSRAERADDRRFIASAPSRAVRESAPTAETPPIAELRPATHSDSLPEPAAADEPAAASASAPSAEAPTRAASAPRGNTPEARPAEPSSSPPSSASNMVEPSSSGPSRDSVSELLRSLQSFAAAPSPREARAAAQRSTPSAERRVDADVDSEPAFETSRPSVIDPAPIPSVAEPRRAEGSIARSEPHPASLATISAAPAQAAFDARVDAARVDEEQVIAEPIGRIDLSAPAANPAPAMAALLAPQARSLIAAGQTVEARPGGGATTNAAQGAAPRSGAAAKTLTIEIAPESLGAVVVKMKIAHSGVDMKISVRSQEALHKLETSRAALVDAMQAVGCAIDGCTIQIASTPTPDSRTPDGGGFFASSNGAETDRGDRGVAGEGASDGQGSGARRRDTARDDGAADGAPRRPADRRGGGVYL